MNEIIHPPFNFSMRPDLGGTSCDFVKEVGRDKIAFYQRYGDRLTKIEIPGPDDFLKISLSEGISGEFFEAYYKFTGELAGARLHFRRYCEQKGFFDKGNPDDRVVDAYFEMLQAGEDLMFDVDMDEKKLIVSHGQYRPDGKFEAFTTAVADFPPSCGAIFQPEPSETDDFIPVDFAMTYRDNMLSMGVVLNEKSVAQDAVSDLATSKMVNIRSTPNDIQEFLAKVFVKA